MNFGGRGGKAVKNQIFDEKLNLTGSLENFDQLYVQSVLKMKTSYKC